MDHSLELFGVKILTFGSWVLIEGLSILVLGDSGSGGVKSFLFLILKSNWRYFEPSLFCTDNAFCSVIQYGPYCIASRK